MLEHRVCGNHPGLHGGVRAFDFWHVKEASRVTHQQAAWKCQLRQRLEAAL